MKFLLIGLACLLLAGCVAAPPPVSTATLPPPFTPTPSVVWFPATATLTPRPSPTLAPTVDQRPGLKGVVLTDNFTDPAAWQTYTNPNGTVSVVNQHWTAAVRAARGWLLSQRKGSIPADFYLEVTFETSICRNKDNFGVLFRSDGNLTFYRLAVSCDGALRLERFVNGGQAVITEWLPAGQLMAGAPAEGRLGVWMWRDQMRFYVNDVLQFSARDPMFYQGGIGLYAQSAGDNVMSVSFRELSVRSVEGNFPPATLTPYPSATATRTPRIP